MRIFSLIELCVTRGLLLDFSLSITTTRMIWSRLPLAIRGFTSTRQSDPCETPTMKTAIPLFLIVFSLTCFAFLSKSQAVVPPPDGGYAGGNTAEGHLALASLDTSAGLYNTAVGVYSLLSITNGALCTAVGAGTLFSNTANENTATGAGALFSNTTGTFNTANGTFALFSNTEGSSNTALGDRALQSNTTGEENTASGASVLLNNTTGNFNTAIGVAALSSNTEGDGNTAIGDDALLSNTIGSTNTAIGSAALESNTTGTFNIAIGTAALLLNATGSRNTATGVQALFTNAADDNTAYGYQALLDNTIGFDNTAIGSGALSSNDGGIANTANGAFALSSNTGGQSNTATGTNALSSNTTANNNTANGNSALASNTTGAGNTAVGSTALSNSTTGNGNIGLGNNAGANVVTASDVICIGSVGKDVNDTCFINHIRGVQTQNANALPVLVDSDGQLGTISSSRRFKKEIRPMDDGSDGILALKPVIFHYKNDATDTPQFGLIAEEVAQVNPDLVARDRNGEIYTVRYDAVNAMLLNEFLKEHRKVEEQQATIAQLKQDFQSKFAEQQKKIEALTKGLERVSAQVETDRSVPQVIVKNP